MKSTPRIALIDDNRPWLDTLAEFLADRGFEVRTAEGGESGLDLLEQSGIRLAVIDFNMPDLNGVELLRVLRERGHEIAALVLSSEEDPALWAEARAAGARAFLSKSTSPRELLRALVQMVVALSFEAAVEALFAAQGERLLPRPPQALKYLSSPAAQGDPLRN